MSRLAAAVALGVAVAATAWAHGPGEGGDAALIIGDPPKPDPTNDALLPKSLNDASRGPASAVLDQMKMWGVGEHLAICFAEPAPAEMRKRIASVANEWTQTANLVFDFGSSPDTPQDCAPGRSYAISIGFKGAGAYSYVGTDSKRYMPSMNLENMDNPNSRVAQDARELRRIVLHEFGHAIGMEHEHQSPAAHCSDQIDWPKAEAYYRQLANWPPEQVHFNLETMANPPRAARDALKISDYDKLSIMQYALPEQIFKQGRDAPCFSATNYDLSPTDKQWVAGLYPRDASGQTQVKQALLANLDDTFKNSGVPDDERKAAITRIGEMFSVSIQQVNNAQRDVNTVTVQKLEQTNSSGVNLGTNTGTINLNFGAPKQ